MAEMNGSRCGHEVFCVLAVIVLYKTKPNDSVAFMTLQHAINAMDPKDSDIQVLLYDNSPGEYDPGSFGNGIQYVAGPDNGGLATAYSYALKFAREKDATWLLTLDQDTALPCDFLFKLRHYALLNALRLDVGAIVPRVIDGVRNLSPVIVRPWGVSYFRHDFIGVARFEVGAVNSGSLFRIKALEQIGGFSEYFWLDHLDADVFRKIRLHGKHVFIAGDIHLKHELSILHEESINPERFRNYLLAESAFYDLYCTPVQRAVLLLRLLRRSVKQQTLNAPQAIRRLTNCALQRRLFLSRKRRINDWRADMKRRLKISKRNQEEPTGESRRPPISVCMATYNGERYVVDQLKSILPQLDDADEIVVVDDASTDATCELISALNDRRIRLLRHVRNLGILQTFEDALRCASNSILFLSDQDDLWDPRKVSVILETFRSHPDVSLVATDNAFIDSQGNLISSSCFTGRGKFYQGLWPNLIRNRYGGCTMAFRSRILGDVLPLPHGYDVLHDIWIGVRNSLSGHKAIYLPDALVLNRRHSSTATGQSRLTLLRRIRIRIHLLLALVRFQKNKAAIPLEIPDGESVKPSRWRIPSNT